MEQSKKKNLLSTALLVAGITIAVNLGPKLFKAEAKDDLTQNISLSERARVMNRDCPFVIDANTRLDSVTSPKENMLQNNYTLLNDDLEDIDIKAFEDIFKPEITHHLKATPQTEDFRRSNATLVYTYFDKEKRFVTNIVLRPGEY
jgi:hypothetical protein